MKKTVNVSRNTYKRAMRIAEKIGLRGSNVIRAVLVNVFDKNLPIKLLPVETDKNLYPLKVKVELWEKIERKAKEMNLDKKKLIDYIFANFSDEEIKQFVEETEELKYKMEKGKKYYVMKECYKREIDYREAAKIANTTEMYAARVYKIFRREDAKKEKGEK